MTPRLRRAAWLAAICLLLISSLGAQTPAPPALPDRLPIPWILRYEQAYGTIGLYVEEPAPEDDAGRVRAELLALTRGARAWMAAHPGEAPTIPLLVASGAVDHAPSLPDALGVAWDPALGMFRTSKDGPFDLVYGAWQQLQGAEEYRRRVQNGGLAIRAAWREMAADAAAPESLKREIETRLFALDHLESGEARTVKRTQELLGQLAAAIDQAITDKNIERGARITMQDIGKLGYIDTLEALPAGGRYVVTRAGEPPAANFNGKVVFHDARALPDALRKDATRRLAERPDYPPAIALAARYAQDPQAALSETSRAIAAWPDVPALRIQRLSLLSGMGRVEELTADFNDLLARFPAAPILLEIETATRAGALAHDKDVRVSIAAPIAEIRPELLNAQLIAYRELLIAGEIDAAVAVRDRLLMTHPGYGPLLAPPVTP